MESAAAVTTTDVGAGAPVVGAGLPLDLPDLAREHQKAALIPLLSDARGIALVVKKGERKERLPDAIVIEQRAHVNGCALGPRGGEPAGGEAVDDQRHQRQGGRRQRGREPGGDCR